MPDLLVRDVAPNLKKDIEEKARSSKRSLSDEIKHLIRVGLVREHNEDDGGSAYSLADAFHKAFADSQLSDEEHEEFSRELEEHRRELPRPVVE